MSAVQEYLNRKRQEEENKEARKIVDFMFEEGLYTKEYHNGDSNTINKYPFLDKAENKRYRKVPISLTDEELKEINILMQEKEKKEAGRKNIAEPDDGNTVAAILRILGFIILCIGIVAGFIRLEESSDIAMTCWVVGILSGALFIGFSEVIKLLQEIRNK